MVSKICHLERSKSSQTHEMFSLAPLGRGIEGEWLIKTRSRNKCAMTRLRHPELVSGSQIRDAEINSA